MARKSHVTEAVVTSGKASAPHDFGNPVIIVHRKEDGNAEGRGVKMDAMGPKNIESDYIEPGQRNNPEYLEKLRAEKLKSDKAKRAMGFTIQTQVLGASPNSPLSKVNVLR